MSSIYIHTYTAYDSQCCEVDFYYIQSGFKSTCISLQTSLSMYVLYVQLFTINDGCKC